MWYLNSEYDSRIIYILPDKEEVVIGRSPDVQICDFTIHEDASISRRHAVFTVKDNSLFVKDLGSRYGTFINNSSEKIENDTNCKLKKNDIVKFGKMKCVWKVNVIKFITCTSTLKGENLHILRQVLLKIGGELKHDWDDTCEYLTMPAITLTIKVVLALVQGSYIVTTDFWNNCLEAINANKPLPSPINFRPDIVESTLNKDWVSFSPDKRRISIFAGKKFVFFSKRQYDMYKSVLLKGNAHPLLLSESNMTKNSLCNDDVVVIQYNLTSASQETEAQKNQIIEMVNYLKSNGKRLVADPEIGLAVLHCSISKYCNPSFNFSSEVVKEAPSQSSNKILAPETQENIVRQNQKENIIINESLVSNDGNLSKRKFSEINDDESNTNANKKQATSNVGQPLNESNKRKHDGEDDIMNPSKKVAVDNDDDMFNFVTPTTSETKTIGGDKLNLAKPQKRKADASNDEDGLFNFVQTEKPEENNAKRTMFDTNKNESTTAEKKTIKPEDISAMRGSKLAELNSAQLNWNENIVKNIKNEDDSLDEKMNQLDIGSIIVTINDSLIVKKEPIEIEDNSGVAVKNFKKFKKVWPVKMQVTVIPKSSMIVVGNDEDDMSNNLTNNSA